MSADTAPAAMPGEMAELIGKLNHYAKHAGCSRALNEVCQHASRELERMAALTKLPVIADYIEVQTHSRLMEARALAAEAALAAERERCIAIVDAQVPDWVKERSGPYWEGYRDAMEDAAEDMRKGVPARAAAIRSQNTP